MKLQKCLTLCLLALASLFLVACGSSQTDTGKQSSTEISRMPKIKGIRRNVDP